MNGIQLDNRASNLQWGTHRQNMQDKIRHGTSKRVKRCPNGHRLPHQSKRYQVCNMCI